MIRILHVVTYMGRGGLETMIMNYYRRMDREQVQFDFLTHRDFRADYDDEIEALGGRIFHLPRLVPWSRSYQKALDAFFKGHPEYRIVHVHQDCLSSVILKAAQNNGVPVRIAHSHNASQDKNLKYILKLYYKRLIPEYATELFACGKAAGDWMFGGAPYRLISNAIDAARYAYDPQHAAEMKAGFGLAPDSFVIGHVGRFSQVKNHAFLLDIFAKIKEEEAKAVLLLVGDGELRKAMESKAESLGLEKSVCFAGVRSDVPELMQAMNVFVFPSLYEGLPVSLVEAQAAGLPCLISEQIPDACMLTELVQKLPLQAGAEKWAQAALQSRENERADMTACMVKCGFDIGSNAAWLQEYYLNQWKEHE